MNIHTVCIKTVYIYINTYTCTLQVPFVAAFAVTGSLGDGFGHSGSHRTGRRGGRQQRFRQGRQEAAPLGNYGADAGAQPTYEGDGSQQGSPTGGDDNLAMLEKSVPGIPGEDYPIYAEVPETAFACDGQVDGGKDNPTQPKGEGIFILLIFVRKYECW